MRPQSHILDSFGHKEDDRVMGTRSCEHGIGAADFRYLSRENPRMRGIRIELR